MAHLGRAMLSSICALMLLGLLPRFVLSLSILMPYVSPCTWWIMKMDLENERWLVMERGGRLLSAGDTTMKLS